MSLASVMTLRRSAAFVATVVATSFVLPMSLHAQTDATAPVAWLAGCWELRTATRVTQEQWMAPLGNSMMGMSRTVAGGALREWESLRIVPMGGTLSYVATPSGQKETVFSAKTVSDTLVAFENPTHDFPQRIAYRRVGADSMVARISGMTNGKERGVDFGMRRVGCGK